MNKKAEIKLVTQGVRGGNITQPKNHGWIKVVLKPDDLMYHNAITFDAYEGMGANYKQRKELSISVISNGRVIFQGTEMEFFHIVHLGVADYNLVKEKKK